MLLTIAAIVAGFTFTAPADSGSGVARYEGVWCESGACVGKNLWGGPAGFVQGPAIPGSPGSPDTVWVVFTESRPVHGVLYVQSVDHEENRSDLSNPCRFATFVRQDTTMYWALEDTTRAEIAEVSPHPSVGAISSLSQRDNLARILVPQLAILLKYRVRSCELFGQWGEAGRFRVCE
jgi:hypothetical protein